VPDDAGLHLQCCSPCPRPALPPPRFPAAQVTSSPDGVSLREAMGAQQTPPSFGGFTFVHESLFGAAYRVSVSDSSDDEFELGSDRDSGVWAS
jgi:hypothetical protein